MPAFNLETSFSIDEKYSVISRSDFLPSYNGNVFLDGLFDVFLGVQKKMATGQSLDAGVRMFFGGYNPNKENELANRIFYNSLVVRYNW